MKEQNILFSVIIPTYEKIDSLKEILSNLKENKLNILEIIIVDSSKSNLISEFVNKYNSDLIRYYKIERAYPGRARNIGINKSKGKWLAFLDSKTIPEKNWFDYAKKQINNNYDIIFGSVKYFGITTFQKYLHAASFGNINHECLPGTIIKKDCIINNLFFLENVRAGEDIAWRKNLKNTGFKFIIPNFNTVIYKALPTNIFQVSLRYFIYSYHATKLNVQNHIKDLYLSLLLILATLVIPKWNKFLPGWDNNPFYIPHVTKIYLISLIFLFLCIIIVRNLFFNKNNEEKFLFFLVLKITLFFSIFLFVYNWNRYILTVIEESIYYIPHITKIYLFLIFFTSIIYRGIILPIKRKILYTYIFPYRWILIGLIGFLLDLIKAPSYILGAMRIPLNELILKIKKNKN